MPATRPATSAWLDTSIAAAPTPRSIIAARSACKSVASGVVSVLSSTWLPTLTWTPPIRPVWYPAARSPDSSRYVEVLLPAVPVTPISSSRPEGSP